MNWHLIYAVAWWLAMVGLFIVAPVAASRYRGDHRRGSR